MNYTILFYIYWGFFFFLSLKKNYLNILLLKKISLISFFLISALFISKTHDDFSYYHLPYTLMLTFDKLAIGLGNLDISYRHISSLFFLNSTLYLPYIKFYSFNFTSLYFLIFFNFYIYNCLLDKKKEHFIKILSLFFFILINVTFTRLSEYGTDLQAQILLSILVLEIFQILQNNYYKFNFINLLIFSTLTLYVITIKSLFIPYLIFLVLIFFFTKIDLKKINNLLFNKYNYFLIFFLLLFLVHNFFNSGCIIFGFKNLCFGKSVLWGVPVDDVVNQKEWIEIWSKAGAGPDFRKENLSEYIKNFNWISNWFQIYFFTKVSDFLLVIIATFIFLSFIFYSKNKKKFFFNKKYFLILYLAFLVLFFIWFMIHPALRYGGYIVITLILITPLALWIRNFKSSNKKTYFKFKVIFLLVIIIFNFKNIFRINSEFKRDDFYKYTNFPFFSVQIKEFEVFKTEQGELLYKANGSIHGHCWALPSPCGNFGNNLNSLERLGFKIYYYR